jgi:hypothetical protein
LFKIGRTFLSASLQDELNNIPTPKLAQVLSFATAVLTKESNTLGLPDFPISNISSIAKILNTAPNSDIYSLVQRLYPYDVMLGKEGQTAVKGLLTKFELLGENDTGTTPSWTNNTKISNHMRLYHLG